MLSKQILVSTLMVIVLVPLVICDLNQDIADEQPRVARIFNVDDGDIDITKLDQLADYETIVIMGKTTSNGGKKSSSSELDEANQTELYLQPSVEPFPLEGYLHKEPNLFEETYEDPREGAYRNKRAKDTIEATYESKETFYQNQEVFNLDGKTYNLDELAYSNEVTYSEEDPFSDEDIDDSYTDLDSSISAVATALFTAMFRPIKVFFTALMQFLGLANM